jgi:hypothetical protein
MDDEIRTEDGEVIESDGMHIADTDDTDDTDSETEGFAEGDEIETVHKKRDPFAEEEEPVESDEYQSWNKDFALYAGGEDEERDMF